tara:strand:+ start:3074 stop:4168 length:1095 start_codon:yes stop_codon:yes gene_type:complete
MEHSIIRRFFPVPKILQNNAVGLDLSNHVIKFIFLEKKKGFYEIKKYGKEVLPKGVIEKGKIKDRKTLIATLRTLNEKHGLDRINLSFPEDKTYLFNLLIPYVSPKELRGSVELQLEEHIPLPLGDIIFDFDIVSYNKETDQLRLNISAMPRTIVSAYTELFIEAGITPISIEAEATSIARSVVPKGDHGTALSVDFGQDRTTIAVVENHHIPFAATLEFGGIDITKAIMKDYNVTYEDAEKLKIEKGVIHNTKNSNDIFATAISSLAVLKDEIQKYQVYWNTKMKKDSEKKNNIERIILSGGGATLRGFTDYLSNYINIPFEIANPWINVLSIENSIPPIEHGEALQYATAISLALNNTLHNE